MRYFWHFLIAATLIVVFVILFFVFSLSVKDKITFTDEVGLTEPIVTIVDPTLGSPTAPITLVNFGDYQCQGCAELELSLTALRAEYMDSIRIVWKDMPNTSLHPQALEAAIAAQCAAEQDMFWEYHSLLMINQEILGPELYTQIATELNLKDRPFARCLEDQSTLPLVQRGFDEGVALGITTTPTLYINGERYTGSLTTSEIRRIIDTIISDL
jgi:protein-disulfide isomerase